MSFNPFNQSASSNVGRMDRGLGSKAGGFVAKKFFHPTTNRNLETIWKNQEAERLQKKKDEEYEKRRQEEKQLEELRAKMAAMGKI